jgi:hypothetical protein
MYTVQAAPAIETLLIVGHKVRLVYLMIVFISLDIITHTHTGLETIQVLLMKIEELFSIKIAVVQRTGLV